MIVCAGSVWLTLALLACSSPSKPSAKLPPLEDTIGSRLLTPAELVHRTKPAIVRIAAKTEAGTRVGTGFVVVPDGRIVTNLHVIGGATEVLVTLLDGTELELTKIMAYDIKRDLALIKVAPDRSLPALRLGDSDLVVPGESVIAIGNPLGVLDYSVSDGLISAVREEKSIKMLQISAPLSEGSSGGPLFNAYGEVIGVAVAIAEEGQNLNFGVPSNYIIPLLIKDKELTLAALSDELREAISKSKPQGNQVLIRKIPQHPVTILDGCTEDSILTTVDGIRAAIQSGAPIYNQGNHEACFRIYEGTAIRLEKDISCTGLRDALGQGLLRASTEQGYTRKAWAMRDTFDGILIVVGKKGKSSP